MFGQASVSSGELQDEAPRQHSDLALMPLFTQGGPEHAGYRRPEEEGAGVEDGRGHCGEGGIKA